MAYKQSHLLPTSALCMAEATQTEKAPRIETKEDEQRKFMCREALESKTTWMSENILNAGQLLLKSKYGTSGLQHTGLGDTLNFKFKYCIREEITG